MPIFDLTNPLEIARFLTWLCECDGYTYNEACITLGDSGRWIDSQLKIEVTRKN